MKKHKFKTDKDLLTYLNTEIKNSENIKPLSQDLLNRMNTIKEYGQKAEQHSKHIFSA
jgi:hypothetical protein